jgi:hypothetical protein
LKLVVINNIKEFELLRYSNFNFQGKSILTTNIELFEKYNDKYQIINLWKYLSNDTVIESEKNTFEILNDFKFNKQYRLSHEGIDTVEIAKINMRYFMKGVVHTFSALSELFKTCKPETVFIKENFVNTMGVVYYDKSDLLYAVTDKFFKDCKIKVEYFAIKYIPKPESGKNYNFNTADYLFNHDKLQRNNKNEKVLIVLSENFEWDFELSKYLQEKHENIFVILKTYSRENPENISKIPLYFEDFNFDSDNLRDNIGKIEVLQEHFLKNKGEMFPEHSELFKSDCLNFQFVDFFEKQKVIFKDLDTFEKVLKFVRPSRIYFSNSWDMGIRCMVKRAMSLNIKTYVTIHGGVVDTSGYFSRSFEADNYFVWGRDNYYGLKNAGQDESSIKITGSMQMEYFKRKADEYKETGALKGNSEYDNIYNFNLTREKKNNKPIVTFFTSSGGGFASHNMNEYKHIDSLKKIIEYARKREDLEFRIKPHVLFDYYEFWENMKTKMPDNLKIIKENNLLQACDEMEIGVLLNVISNVAYEISLTGKPLIYLKDAVFDAKCGESTIERGGILCLNSFDELEGLMEKYFGAKESNELKADFEKRRIQFLEYSLADFSKPVIERIEELIMKDKYNNSTIAQTATDENVYKIIDWVSSFISNEKIERFPSDIDYSKLPSGEDFINWIYNLAENWSRYFKKEARIDKFFNELLTGLPKEVGVDISLKIKRKVYAKTRAMYLKYGLNENEKFRKIVKKIIN